MTSLLEGVLRIPHEDKANKLEMLRKIENEVWFLADKRDYVAGKPRGTLTGNGLPLDLEGLENKYDKKRKEIRKERIIEKEEAQRREKQEKNDAKKLKQQNLVIFKGRPEMQRARKKDLKPKEKNDEKPSQEIMDQLRYLGLKVYDQPPPQTQTAQPLTLALQAASSAIQDLVTGPHDKPLPPALTLA